jgi:hypothetical protein
VLDEEDSHVAAAQVHGDVRCLRPHKRNVNQLSLRLLRTFTGLSSQDNPLGCGDTPLYSNNLHRSTHPNQWNFKSF